MKPNRLFLLDVDGTSVDDRGILLPETIQSLTSARQQQTLICFVTGRCEFEMATLLPDLSCADYLIVNNGSDITDLQTGKRLKNELVDAAEAEALINLCLSHHFLLHVKAGMYWGVNYFDDSVQRFSDFAERSPVLYRSANEVPLREIDGFSITSEPACEAIDALILREKMNIKTVHSQADYFDIMRKDVSKWAAITWIAARHGLSTAQMIAVGNFSNDVEMIQNAGIGIAVQNANDNAKAAADYVTQKDNNHNAVGEVVERFILNQ